LLWLLFDPVDCSMRTISLSLSIGHLPIVNHSRSLSKHN
jgi:hypothetical protein